MPLQAVFSDVHGNLAALKAVLARIDELDIERILCLGDTIGYGPQPAECLELVRERCDIILMGNHEYAVLNDAEGFNPIAEEAVAWTRRELATKFGDEVFDYLRTLKAAHMDGHILFVHGSIKDPLMDYVRELDSYASFKRLVDTIHEDFRQFQICFTGHNHRAFLGTDEGLLYPHELVRRFFVRDSKLYICVGAVGQPRDSDPRAAFVTFDGEWVEYHRVEYDISATAEAIREVGLHPFLAERLYAGQ